jgi:hypothetical protein
VTSPEGKEARVRKPYKKPRQVTVKETEEPDSQAPTQLGHGETVDNSATVDNSGTVDNSAPRFLQLGATENAKNIMDDVR